ncbi:ABC transporter substrate-binding protein [Paenibacillus sepulcri]|uniref:ABC transporter substrate-binding protein n=1 Tax=Paenibacillus sepulcri TaxID=359917 RepID=A0ABS7C502_9BACL|nr:ABC transporter substrate-binding protein [Paenibacillus sepulcri]
MKRKMLATIALSTALLLTAAGCGGAKEENAGSSSPTNTSTSESPAATNYSIGISQYAPHPSLDATKEGFLAALKDAGIVEGENLKIDDNNAQGESSNNLSIAQKFGSEKFDLVLGIATPSALALADNVKDKPVLFAAVTDPLDAQIVSDLDKPGGNITGASDSNPAAITQLMDFIAENFSTVKSVGVVINEGESNSVIMAKQAETALAAHDIKLVKAPVTNTSEVQQAAQSLVGRADAIYITLDNTVVSAVDAIIKVAADNKLPFFSSDRDTVEAGAFATVGFKYYDHGYQVGQMAVDILKNGKNPGDMKITIPDKLDLILNLKAAEAFGITVTDAMKEKVQDKENNIIQ